MAKLSTKQLTILQCIYDNIEANGYPPTVREIGSVVGLSSTSTVHGHLSRLEKGGYLIKDSSKTRALELTQLAIDLLGVGPVEVPLLGKVAAGSPILAIEDATAFYPVPPELNYDPSELIMLEVKGDSMVNVGIMDGDIITVRRQTTADNGEIVIAMTDDDEVTCKTFFKKSDHFILKPENDYMEDIVLKSVTLLGKVVSLFRRF
ncbi:transcriptional repressor LexA [Fundicoccus ignavus]|uniref:LexA repressor n=1 Tax=Fundicoccus ignavus TaxID=2664442 RepID=A0A844BWY8_9LACT|nr:transcriptional repressor LexA [Fundicoccus ignavus]MRJ46458.1 transcriptional repressor LexA [Fundicoccus ignavus]